MKSELAIYADNSSQDIFDAIISQSPFIAQKKSASFKIESRISREDYIDAVKKLQQHILRGDCYEVNFCQEFFATNAIINPLTVYNSLVAISPNPFSRYIN
jgi:para-aminobenzoate synthetase component 1